ncbi:MAG: hypothetical protein ACLSWI_00335 [Candidatus Gastranaerophilaceae bacterium]
MLNIREEIKLLLMRSGISMNKLISKLLEIGCDIKTPSTISEQLKNNRIRFQTVQEMLDYLGYELVIREKQK